LWDFFGRLNFTTHLTSTTHTLHLHKHQIPTPSLHHILYTNTTLTPLRSHIIHNTKHNNITIPNHIKFNTHTLVQSPQTNVLQQSVFPVPHFTGFLICSQFKKFLMFNFLPYGCLLEGPLKRLMLSMDHIDKVWLWFQVNQNLLNIFAFPVNTNNNTTKCTPTQPQSATFNFKNLAETRNKNLPTRHMIIDTSHQLVRWNLSSQITQTKCDCEMVLPFHQIEPHLN